MINTDHEASAQKRDGLEARAAALARFVADVAMDQNGVVRGLVHAREPRPLRADDLPSDAWSARNIPPADYLPYEDAGMATGEFLAAQSYRCLATGSREARELADRAFAGICWIYDLGRARAEGFFPKPYGGRISDQISRDQYLYTMHGLAAYHAIADVGGRARIASMMGAMGRYWMSIDYRTSYFGLPAASHLDDFMGSLYLGILALARDFSGDARLAREYLRLRDDLRLGERMGETLRGLFRAGRTYDGGSVFRQHENPVMMKTLAIDILWEADPEWRACWRTALRRFWDDELFIMLDPETGRNYWFMGYDPATDRPFLTEPGVFPGLTNPLELAPLTWGGRRQSTGSTKTAYSALVAADRLGLPEGDRVARHILEKLDLANFALLSVPDERHLPPGFAWQTHAICVDHLACWQSAYWLGRLRRGAAFG